MSEELVVKFIYIMFFLLSVHSIRMGNIDVKNWLNLRPSKIKLTKKKAGFYTGLNGFVSY